MDESFLKEAEKLMAIRRMRIENGYAPKYENSISYYQIPVPHTFPKAFREIRNRRNHIKPQRASRLDQNSLSEFFRKYHRFIILLFEEAAWLWSIKDEESQDWGEIEDFLGGRKFGYD